VSQPYLSLEAELHDVFWEAEGDASEVRMMAGFLGNHRGHALEIGSGSGRLMFPLMQQGFQIEGLELSPDMRALGKTRAAELGLNPVVHAGDMSTWDEGRRYAALLAPAFTFQLAEDPEVALRHWHLLLLPGGALYLTVFIPHAELFGDLPENSWYPDRQVILPDGRTASLESLHQLDRGRQILFRKHRYILSGNPPLHHESSQTIRWFGHREMVGMLNRTGFQNIRFSCDFDPGRIIKNPDRADFDGILTYQAVRPPEKGEIV